MEKKIRKSCKECPWRLNNSHSLKWREYSSKVKGDNPHACHMITKDVWGIQEEITETNVCIGSIK
jgi:hypothetical protein